MVPILAQIKLFKPGSRDSAGTGALVGTVESALEIGHASRSRTRAFTSDKWGAASQTITDEP
jgi:hypothetical protein